MQLKYNGAAQKSGVFVISACGFDSIPAESGVLHAKEKFEGWITIRIVNLTKSPQGFFFLEIKESNL